MWIFLLPVIRIRGSLEIEMSNLKGLAKLTRKGDLQRKIDEKTDYINRLKVGLSNMVRNSGFENMNEFLPTFSECRNAYTDYQRQYESWMPAENRIHLRIRMKNCRINLQDYKGKPLKTRTVSAGRQRTEGQDNMPFVLYSFDGITIEYWNLA